MIKYLLLLLFIAGYGFAQAQTALFDYDDAGNRIQRNSSPIPDLTPAITFTGSTFLTVGTSKTLTFRISNIVLNTATNAPVTIRVFRPTAATGLSITPNAPDFDIVTAPLYYDLTLKSGLTIISTATPGYRQFTGVLARTGGSAGTYLFNVMIISGSGGELNAGNNTGSITFTKL